MKPLGKYSGRDIWNIVYRFRMKPLGKYSRWIIWNIVYRFRMKTLGIYSTRCELRSQLMKDPAGILNRRNIWTLSM